MYAQVDTKGNHYILLDSIIDFATDGNAVQNGDEYITTRRGQRRLRNTTAGWKLLVIWKDSSEQWIPLAYMKASNPVEVSEFSKSRNIHDEPAFKWWVPHVLKRSNHIVQAMRSMVRKGHTKLGVEVPKTVEEDLLLDKKNGNDLWQKALEK